MESLQLINLKFKNQFNIIKFFFSTKKLKIGIMIILSIIYGFIEMLVVGAMYPVIKAALDHTMNPNSVENGIGLVEETYLRIANIFGVNILLVASIILILTTLFAFIFKSIYLIFYQKTASEISVYNKNALFDVLCNANYSFFVEERQGELVYNSVIAADSILSVILTIIELLSESFKIIFIIFLFIFTSVNLTFIILLIGIIYVVIFRKVTVKIINKAAKENLKQLQRQHTIINEFIIGIKEIKIYVTELLWKKKYSKAVKKSAKLIVVMEISRFLPSYILQMVMGVIIGISGIIIGNQSLESITKIGPVLGLFIIGIGRVSGSLQSVTNSIAVISRHLPNLKVCFSLMNNSSIHIKSILKGEKRNFIDRINIENINFKYPNTDKYVLKDISFAVKKNKTYALVGGSGSGKTTILNILLQLYTLESGVITIDGININEITLDSFLSQIGFVGQQTFLFNGTVIDNIQFGMECSISEVIEACKQADAHEFISSLDAGYNTIVGDRGLKLSGGQGQRIAIARALLRKTNILVFDEPTSALDNNSEDQILGTLKKLSEGKTIIIVAHRLSTIMFADEIYVLNNGIIVENGTHKQLIKNNGYYSKLYSKEGGGTK